MFNGDGIGDPFMGAADFVREYRQIDDAAADDPTLRLLGLDYLVVVSKKTKAAANIVAAKGYFKEQKWEAFRREMIIAAHLLNVDVMDLCAFLPGKVSDQDIRRMVVQLAMRCMDCRLGYYDSPFAAILATRMVN